MAVTKIALIGTGLIGGSFALALREDDFDGEIIAAGRRESALQRAVDRGIAHRYTTDFQAAVREADLVFLAVPMLAMGSVLERIAPALRPDTIVTDGGSVKGSFERDVREHLSDLTHVVPGHPIAGTEMSGVESGFPTLYQNRRVILTPLPETAQRAINVVTGLWQQCGARVECLDVAHHDRVLAATSHLPHMLAFGLVDTLSTLQEREEIFRYAAGGFRDFTRIASGDPVMWRDIALTNREALLAMMDLLQSHMDTLRTAIDQGDSETIENIFINAKRSRDQFVG